MARARVNGVEIYYELGGASDKEVLLILNGIMMSTESWGDAKLAVEPHYRVLTVDFRDQGRSEKMPEGSEYLLNVHADDLVALLDELGLAKVHILGLSYGGEVAMIFALKYPERVNRLILANTTARVTPHLRAIGEAWEEAAKLYDGERFFKLAMPFIYSTSFYEHHAPWLKEREVLFGKILEKSWFDAYIRLSRSTREYDIMEEIQNIHCKTLCLAADEDLVTPVTELQMIHQRIAGSQLQVLPHTGHACCYEQKDLFHHMVLQFLKA